VLTEYAGRWSIEETIQGSKTCLGFEEPQGWSRNEQGRQVQASGPTPALRVSH
jgi:hypothetical protein